MNKILLAALLAFSTAAIAAEAEVAAPAAEAEVAAPAAEEAAK